MEDEAADRQKKIQFILDQEIRDGQDLGSRARAIVEYLLLEKKGYDRKEIKKKIFFDVVLGQEKLQSSVDFVVTVEGLNAMIIKCFAGSLVSRERQAVAAARVFATPCVPLAVVADPETAEVLDAATGEVIGEGFGAIPLRSQIMDLLRQMGPKEFSSERIEKEKRILLAFDAIACCVPQGGDGGVDIGPGLKEKK